MRCISSTKWHALVQDWVIVLVEKLPLVSVVLLPRPQQALSRLRRDSGHLRPRENLSSLQGPLNVTSTCASFAEKRPVLVHATAEGSEAGAEQPEEPKPVTKIEDMPLESKQKMIMEQRARMKLAKKLRQRRKRLLCKRKLRKKGRWPPSKMKKLKHV
ncbi:50S ribosomal protein 5, chloroplastic [Sorghum bicolor]|uniref:50S ribosomal protein 5, chloroplastic n=1 Tax=Sorghum bicolor TaxID=4558 RepID=UPI000B426C18|nr:50S ribosomal protein 5, chloroplastic [Sorghum bicolor]|eukprot:XP_002443230.2 50S ribosomal protein 5, chloroplastic [Sorghum bicolor]